MLHCVAIMELRNADWDITGQCVSVGAWIWCWPNFVFSFCPISQFPSTNLFSPLPSVSQQSQFQFRSETVSLLYSPKTPKYSYEKSKFDDGSPTPNDNHRHHGLFSFWYRLFFFVCIHSVSFYPRAWHSNKKWMAGGSKLKLYTHLRGHHTL